MKMTPAVTWVPAYLPAARHIPALCAFSGATPSIDGVEGTSVSRVRMTQGNAGDDKAQGPAARGRPV